MAANLVADFRVLRRSAFELKKGDWGPSEDGVATFTKELLDLPEDAALNRRTILEFLANPSSNAEDLEFEIQIYERWVHKPPAGGWGFGAAVPQEDGRTAIYRGSFTGGVKRALSAIIEPGWLLRPNPPWRIHGSNKDHDADDTETTGPDGKPVFPEWRLTFRVTDGKGSVEFSNVILWFHRDLSD